MSKFKKAALATAYAYSKLSHCKRRQVGAVITSKDNRVLMVGYNGASKDMPNPCEGPGGLTLPHIHHAEANAIGYCAKKGVATEGCSMYITTSPCIDCAKLIEISGIDTVYYAELYKSSEGIDYLKGVGVQVEQINN